MAMIDISLVVSDYRALGIDLPPDAVEVLDIWTALREAVDAKPGDDLRALLTDGILTAANAPDRLKEAALVLALKAGMQSLVIDLDRPATIRAKAAFAADAPRVVAELAPPFDDATATVLEGLAHFSPEEFARPELLLTQRPGAAAHYHPTTEASATLDTIARLINAIRPLASPVSGYVRLTDDATAETLAAAQSAYAAGSPSRWVGMYATAGVEASLNTEAEAQAVVSKSADLGRTRDAEATDRGVRARRKEERRWLVS
jgi:hypothetical protein